MSLADKHARWKEWPPGVFFVPLRDECRISLFGSYRERTFAPPPDICRTYIDVSPPFLEIIVADIGPRLGFIQYSYRAKWRHRIYGHDTIAILWVHYLAQYVELIGEDLPCYSDKI